MILKHLLNIHYMMVADAIVANRLLGMGITINPHNVDWYKRTLISGTSFK
jgi:hypothetical protein